jgi:ArsR family transcriptional regulator, arsenate/arsenite/antimonite-responsive transcriptional repressor
MNIEEQAEMFNALADPTRLKLFKLLSVQPDTGALCVNALANVLEISQPAVSQHLKILRSVGLIEGEKRGNLIHYRINRAKTKQYQKTLLATLSVKDVNKSDICEECSGKK